MQDPHSSSFIPKNNPTKRKHGGANTRKIYIFTLISYVILFATLISTAGVYFYEKHVNNQLAVEITNLGREVSSFNLVDMQRVVEFDRRLKQAQKRLENMASPVAIFDTLEKVVVKDAQINTLNISREEDNFFDIKADMLTDSFDSTITQRKEYFKNEVIDSVNIANIVTEGLDYSIDGLVNENNQLKPEVKFNVDLKVPVSSVLYTPDVDSELDFVSEFTENDDVNIVSDGVKVETDNGVNLGEEELIDNTDI